MIVGKERTPGSGPLLIGQRADGLSQDFAGRIDEVRLYNHALTLEQIKVAFDRGSSAKSANGCSTRWLYACSATFTCVVIS